jgi:hypothetical protein
VRCYEKWLGHKGISKDVHDEVCAAAYNAATNDTNNTALEASLLFELKAAAYLTWRGQRSHSLAYLAWCFFLSLV